MEAVSLGHHLNPPEGCPDIIKTIMLSCWKICPNERIKFSKIVENLSEDNIEKVLDTSNTMYGKLRPLSYTDKSKNMILNRVDKSNVAMEKNKLKNSEQSPLILPEENDNYTGEQLSSDQISAFSLGAQEYDIRSPETEYTIIIANDYFEEE